MITQQFFVHVSQLPKIDALIKPSQSPYPSQDHALNFSSAATASAVLVSCAKNDTWQKPIASTE
jgi:hypothetical protein